MRSTLSEGRVLEFISDKFIKPTARKGAHTGGRNLLRRFQSIRFNAASSYKKTCPCINGFTPLMHRQVRLFSSDNFLCPMAFPDRIPHINSPSKNRSLTAFRSIEAAEAMRCRLCALPAMRTPPNSSCDEFSGRPLPSVLCTTRSYLAAALLLPCDQRTFQIFRPVHFLCAAAKGADEADFVLR